MRGNRREGVERQALERRNRNQDIQAVESGRQGNRRNNRYGITRIAEDPAELRNGECPLGIAPWPGAVSQDGTRLRAERHGAKSSEKARQRDPSRARLSKSGQQISGYHSSRLADISVPAPCHRADRRYLFYLSRKLPFVEKKCPSWLFGNTPPSPLFFLFEGCGEMRSFYR